MDAPETCEFCGSARLVWRKCKQVCLDCNAINRSCADLHAAPSTLPPGVLDS